MSVLKIISTDPEYVLTLTKEQAEIVRGMIGSLRPDCFEHYDFRELMEELNEALPGRKLRLVDERSGSGYGSLKVIENAPR